MTSSYRRYQHPCRILNKHSPQGHWAVLVDRIGRVIHVTDVWPEAAQALAEAQAAQAQMKQAPAPAPKRMNDTPRDLLF